MANTLEQRLARLQKDTGYSLDSRLEKLQRDTQAAETSPVPVSQTATQQAGRGVIGHSGSEKPQAVTGAKSARELRQRAAKAENPLARLVGESVTAGVQGSAAGLTGALSTLVKGADMNRRGVTDKELTDRRAAISESQGKARSALRRGDVETARRYTEDAGKLRAALTPLEEEKEAEALREGTGTLSRAANRLDAVYDDLRARAAAHSERAVTDQRDAVGRVASELITQGTQMLGDAAANAIAPGAGLAVMGARSFGDASQQARQSGASVGEQIGYGISNAGVEVLTEKMFDGLAGIYGKGGADEVVEKVIDKLAKNDRGRAALKVLASMGGEALEEVVSGVVDPALESIYQHNDVRDNYSRETAADIAYSALIGGLLGGLGGAAEIARGNAPKYLKGPRDPGASAAQPRAGETGQFGSSEGNPTSETNGAKMAQKTAPNEAGAVGLVQQVRNVIPVMSGAPTVVSITGTEIPKVGTVVDRLTAFANSIGNKINRPGFGDVLFSRKRIKNAFIGHGIGDAKIDAFAAVPAVIQRGEQIGYEHNWKGRGYDSYVFTAPIEYKGSRDYLGVIVTKNASDSRYYVHEVVDADGNLIFEEKESAGDTSDERATLPGAFGIVASPANSDITIPQPSNAVKSDEVPNIKGLQEAINKKSTKSAPDDAAEAVPQMYAQSVRIDAADSIPRQIRI